MPTTLIDTQGISHDVADSEVDEHIARGWKPQTHANVLSEADAKAREATYGGVGGAIKAGLAGAARGVTLGLSDVAMRALGGEDAGLTLEGLREENPALSIGTEVGGALAASLLTAGAATPAGLAARAGRGITELGAEAGTLGKIGYGVLGGAAEGALYGAGAGASELALSQDPLTLEHAASALSSNMLFGGLTGGVAGGLGKAAELGIARAKGAIDGALARKVLQETTPDIAAMDARQLAVAQKGEIEAIEAARAPAREQFVADLDHFRQEMAEQKLSKVVTGSADRESREAGNVLRRTDNDIRRLTDNTVGLTAHPERALGALQTQRQALADMQTWLTAEVQGYPARVQRIASEVRESLLSGKLEGFNPAALSERGKDLAVELTLRKSYGIGFDEAGALISPANHGRLADLAEAIQRNEALQRQLAAVTAEPASERLSQILQAKEAMHLPKDKPLGELIMSAAAPVLGPMGTIAAAGGRVFGGFRKVAEAAGRRLGKAASVFLGAAGKAAPYAAPLATKVLASVRYAPGDDKGADDQAPTHGESRLAKLYKARTDEVKSQTAYDEMGVPRMRPAARAAVAERLKPVRAVDPVLADRMETAAARRLEYLSSLIPRRPDMMATQFGPDRWQPSSMEMRSWARSAAAVEDPDAVLERAAHGMVSIEDADALRAVWPEKLDDFIRQVGAKLPTLQKSLPYSRRISLSLLTGLPVDPSMEPAILRVLQAQYQYEPPAGGPRAEAQFGSVRLKENVATPSQRREEGTAA